MEHSSSEGAPMAVDWGSWAAQHAAIEAGELGDSDGDGGLAEAKCY